MIIDDMKLWDRELEAEVKAGALERIAATKLLIFDILSRHHLTGPAEILLHIDGPRSAADSYDKITAQPYRTWYGKLKFVHPERMQLVAAWQLYEGVFKFALLSDGDIAEFIHSVPIAGSDESMEYYQTIDLCDKRCDQTQLKIIQSALDRHLVVMQRFDS